MNEIVCLKIYNSRIEAELAQTLLESAGIASMVSADDVGGLYSMKFTLSGGGAKLLVSEADFASAQEIINSNPS